MNLRASIRQKRRPGANLPLDADLPTRTITSHGPDKRTAFTALIEQIPDGWQLLFEDPT